MSKYRKVEGPHELEDGKWYWFRQGPKDHPMPVYMDKWSKLLPLDGKFAGPIPTAEKLQQLTAACEAAEGALHDFNRGDPHHSAVVRCDYCGRYKADGHTDECMFAKKDAALKQLEEARGE